MRFLVDNALSPIVSQGLRAAGIEAIHVRDVGLSQASDSAIFTYAYENDCTIISADTDFGTLLALRQSERPSVIIFRQTDKRPGFQLSFLIDHMKQIGDSLLAGSVVVFEDSRIRIRQLPIG